MSETKAEKLAALRAAKAALEAEQAAKEAAFAEDVELAAAELALADEQAWADALKGNDRASVERVSTEAGTFIVKKPHGAAFRAFGDQKESKTEDVEKLVWPCIVYPAKLEAGRRLEQKPGILADLLVAVCALAGSSAAARAKKSSR